jgi:hypothetical protein
MSGFTLRDLESRVNKMRPDLEPGDINKIMQEIAKQVMRDSYLFQVEQTVFPIKADANELLLSSSLGYWGTTCPNAVLGGTVGLDTNKAVYPASWSGSTPDILSGLDTAATQKTPAEVVRVMRVRTARPPYTQSCLFAGWMTFDSSTTTYSLPAASTSNQGQFLLAHGTGTATDPSSNAFVVKTGDMLQSDGTSWLLRKLEEYATMPQMNGPAISAYAVRPKTYTNNKVASTQWSQRHGQVTGLQTAGTSFYFVVDYPIEGSTIDPTMHFATGTITFADSGSISYDVTDGYGGSESGTIYANDGNFPPSGIWYIDLTGVEMHGPITAIFTGSDGVHTQVITRTYTIQTPP